MSEKRNDYITWDEYFLGVAKLSAMRSKLFKTSWSSEIGRAHV